GIRTLFLQFILQFQDDPLCGLGADAFDLLNNSDLSVDDSGLNFFRSDRRQHHTPGIGAYPRYRNQVVKQMTFTLCREAIQIMGIFAYLEGNEKFARFQIFNLTESRQGNMDMIPNTPNLKDDMGGGFGYQFTIKIIVHFVYFVELLWACASTTAMVTILTISRTELSNCKTCTGLFIPRRIGPTASASPTSCSNL